MLRLLRRRLHLRTPVQEKERFRKEKEEKWIKIAPRRVLPLPRFDGAEREGSILPSPAPRTAAQQLRASESSEGDSPPFPNHCMTAMYISTRHTITTEGGRREGGGRRGEHLSPLAYMCVCGGGGGEGVLSFTRATLLPGSDGRPPLFEHCVHNYRDTVSLRAAAP